MRFRDDEHILRVIERIAARVGRRIDSASPMVDLRLPDGSRVNATIPPVSLDGPTISIRRFGRRRLRQQDLLGWGTMSPAMLEFLSLAVEGRRNILISGTYINSRVLRVEPALNIAYPQLDTFLNALEDSLGQVERDRRLA